MRRAFFYIAALTSVVTLTGQVRFALNAGPQGVLPTSSQPRSDAAESDALNDVPVFRTGTRLVQVDVVVRGKDAPIRGLTKDDFEVTDRGKKQNIAIFAVRENDKSKTIPKLPAGVVTNRPLQSGPEPITATIILVDHLNGGFVTPDHATKFMKMIGDNERIAIYSLNQTVTVVQPFTNDREALRRALIQSANEVTVVNQTTLEGITGNAANAANLNALERRASMTAAGFEALARHLKGLPGRKKVLWISPGLPLTQLQKNQRNGTMMYESSNFSDKLFKATRALNDANAAIYAIDPSGIECSSPSCFGSPDPNPAGDLLMKETLTSLIRMSEMTGGTAFYVDNGIAEGMDLAVNDTDLTYTLGFYPSEDTLDGAFHSVSVKILRTRPETKAIKDVRYRRGYNAESSRPPLTDLQRKGTLNAWVEEPLDATEIGIQAVGVPAKKAGYYDIEVAVDVSDLKLERKNNRWVGVFELAVVPDVANKPRGLHQVFKVNLTEQSYANALAHGITVVNQVRVADDKGKLLSKRLHFVVMDGVSGKSGSVRIPISQ